eukprot:scaffold15130_cov127-Skeletonema_dohrnii-CCMP3373.AAC.9
MMLIPRRMPRSIDVQCKSLFSHSNLEFDFFHFSFHLELASDVPRSTMEFVPYRRHRFFRSCWGPCAGASESPSTFGS